MNIQKSSASENTRFRLRSLHKDDAEDLLQVYSDLYALPFFNSDNCDGDIFYYPELQKMKEAVHFWLQAYANGWFYRYTVEDKYSGKAIGTVEICRRVSNDAFNGMCILRIDLGSRNEKADTIGSILELAKPLIREKTGTDRVLIKGPVYAIERLKALEQAGYSLSNETLVGKNGHPYFRYFTGPAE